MLTPEQEIALAVSERTLRHRLAAMGEQASGLYGFYAHRLERGNLLGPDGSAAIPLIRANRWRWRRVWDVGAGVGQLAAMLAVEGAAVVAIEDEPARFAALVALFDAVKQAIPECADRLYARHALFPAACADADCGLDLALVFSCAFKASAQQYEEFERALARFDAAIVEFGALFSGADTPAEERDGESRAARFCVKYGLPAPRLLCPNVHLVGRGAHAVNLPD